MEAKRVKAQTTVIPAEEAPETLPAFLRPFAPEFDPLRYSKGKSHFQFAFLFVRSTERRLLLDQFYAFCRLADDLADENANLTLRKQALTQIETWLEREELIGHPFWDSFLKHLQKFSIPRDCLQGILDGVKKDLPGGASSSGYPDWKALEDYIQGVAVDVGRGVLYILGAQDPALDPYATHLGRCVQLINFCRDLEEDISIGRLYFPKELEKGDLGSPSVIQDLRTKLWDRAIDEWKQSEPYSWKCLAPELMVRIYIEAGHRWWRHGDRRRLRRLEKLQLALKHALYFLLEGLKLKQPWMK